MIRESLYNAHDLGLRTKLTYRNSKVSRVISGVEAADKRQEKEVNFTAKTPRKCQRRNHYPGRIKGPVEEEENSAKWTTSKAATKAAACSGSVRRQQTAAAYGGNSSVSSSGGDIGADDPHRHLHYAKQHSAGEEMRALA